MMEKSLQHEANYAATLKSNDMIFYDASKDAHDVEDSKVKY
jgi:hypothetical protein